jgi:hypothetical protein
MIVFMIYGTTNRRTTFVGCYCGENILQAVRDAAGYILTDNRQLIAAGSKEGLNGFTH